LKIAIDSGRRDKRWQQAARVKKSELEHGISNAFAAEILTSLPDIFSRQMLAGKPLLWQKAKAGGCFGDYARWPEPENHTNGN
jgi:hypothetical protein